MASISLLARVEHGQKGDSGQHYPKENSRELVEGAETGCSALRRPRAETAGPDVCDGCGHTELGHGTQEPQESGQPDEKPLLSQCERNRKENNACCHPIQVEGAKYWSHQRTRDFARRQHAKCSRRDDDRKQSPGTEPAAEGQPAGREKPSPHEEAESTRSAAAWPDDRPPGSPVLQ